MPDSLLTPESPPPGCIDFVLVQNDRAVLPTWRFLFCLMAIFCLILLVPATGWAQAAGSDFFGSVQSKTTDIFTNVRNILMVVGALGVLGLAASAFFGHFKWSWAVSLLGGLALIAFVSQLITYFGLTAPATGQ